MRHKLRHVQCLFLAENFGDVAIECIPRLRQVPSLLAGRLESKWVWACLAGSFKRKPMEDHAFWGPRDEAIRVSVGATRASMACGISSALRFARA